MPNYTLHYFNGKGRAELTRLVFAAGGIEFTDDRVEFADWPGKKSQAPLGQMPYLEIDGAKLPQSIAIARYVAKECNMAGKTNLEQVRPSTIFKNLIKKLKKFINILKGSSGCYCRYCNGPRQLLL